MKSFKVFSLAILALGLVFFTQAQNITETFKVSGNCGMCKTRIEKAAKAAGAQEASWDKDTKQLTVTFAKESTSLAKIQQKIAEVGHDNDAFKATNDTYNKLPACCKYERATSEQAGMADCCKKDGDKMTCSKEGHDGKDCCKKDGDKMNCSKEGQAGASCCEKKEGGANKMNCSKEGQAGASCCNKN